jgi:hypothetical protein
MKLRYGWVRTDGSAYLRRTVQYGEKVSFKASTTLPTITFTANVAALADIIPTTAASILLVLRKPTTSACAVAPNSSYVLASAPLCLQMTGSDAGRDFISIMGEFQVEASSIYLLGTNGVVYHYGWRDNL